MTKPPEDMEKLYVPSSVRFMVMGSLLETKSNLPWTLGSSATEGILEVTENFELVVKVMWEKRAPVAVI